ncbi:glycosyltransferase family 9 protein [bacterium]|nr:glycosyltransferase family 9 protein [bacterium]
MPEALVIQTAFAGDLILTTPLIEAVATCADGNVVDVLCIPGTAPLLENNPHVREILPYDKKTGRPGLLGMMQQLSRRGYDLCISPHRSMRSAMLARASRAKQRISFDRSAGGPLYTQRIPYERSAHEVDRNLSLLHSMDCTLPAILRPALYPADAHREEVVKFFNPEDAPFLVLAPGSVWATKRWTTEGFASLADAMRDRYRIALIGGRGDEALCREISETLPPGDQVNLAGKLSFLASAYLIEQARMLVSNDSAPVHIASAMGTPVVEIYGATSPAYGFTPYAVPHRIVQREDLPCKPCAIHGGDHCPIQTFVCMRELSSTTVQQAVEDLLAETAVE